MACARERGCTKKRGSGRLGGEAEGSDWGERGGLADDGHGGEEDLGSVHDRLFSRLFEMKRGIRRGTRGLT